jgi:hemerythrin
MADAYTWDDDLLTGVRIIDDQHREFFAEVNNLLRAAARQEGQLVLGRFIQYIKRYAETHFAAEEELMTMLDPVEDREEHVAQHRLFAEQIEQAHAGLETYSLEEVSRLCDLVVTWLSHHIPRYDMVLARDMKHLS